MAKGQSRVVLITGASSGIGRATAELLAGRGYRVFGGVRAPATTSPLAGVELIPLDVRDETSIRACVGELCRRAVPRDNQDERPATIRMRMAPGVG